MEAFKTKNIGLFSATALGISSIIGSGWLFASYKAATVAGPASIFAWLLGALIICLLGLLFAEIATLFPRRGLSAIIPTLSHNKYFAFPFAIANWLGIVAVIALEADATIEYLINLFPASKPFLYHHEHLTFLGNSFSILLVLGFSLLNAWGASLMVKASNLITVLKVTIPVFIGLVILFAAFHPNNFVVFHHTFMPYGVQSIFTALLTTGIIIAFNGFQTVISFASEVKNPSKTIPISVIASVLICLLVYLLLQISFIGALPTEMVEQGWHHLHFNAPEVQILGLVGLGIFSSVAYLGATVAPTGSGVAFSGTGTRMFTAMAQNQQMPKFFDNIHPVYGVSRSSLVVNTAIAVAFLLLFPSWGRLAQVLSLFHIISYLPVAIAIWVFRKKIPAKAFVLRIPFARCIALALFVLFSYLFTLAKMDVISDLMTIFALSLMGFVVASCRSKTEIKQALKDCWPLLVYFLSLIILSHLSPQVNPWLSEPAFISLTIIVSSVLFFSMVFSSRSEITADKQSTSS